MGTDYKGSCVCSDGVCQGDACLFCGAFDDPCPQQAATHPIGRWWVAKPEAEPKKLSRHKWTVEIGYNNEGRFWWYKASCPAFTETPNGWGFPTHKAAEQAAAESIHEFKAAMVPEYYTLEMEI